MAANARCVLLPAYPTILLKRKEEQTPEEFGKRLEALVTHYHLTSEFGFGLDGEYRRLHGGPRVTKDAWHKLAVALACDFVPAFRIRRKAGRPKIKAEPANYLFGVLNGFSRAEVESYTQALFVKVVREAQGSKSREAAFLRLERDAKLRNKLPPRYRNLKTRGSLRQMWTKIPKAIRDDPDSYLRPPAERGLFGIPRSELEKMLAGKVESAGSK
jgi:hypothetical protein